MQKLTTDDLDLDPESAFTQAEASDLKILLFLMKTYEIHDDAAAPERSLVIVSWDYLNLYNSTSESLEGTGLWSLRAAGLGLVLEDVLPPLRELLQFKDPLSTFSHHFIQVHVR